MSLLPKLREEDRLKFKEREELLESGVLLIDKPAGISSMDVIRLIKRVIRAKKIGHGGTLDPFATGLLPIMLNRATRFSNELMDREKAYIGVFHLGQAFDTQDITGQALHEMKEIPHGLTLEKIQEVANSFVGEIEQIPPIYSAVKKEGKALYLYAREGKEVEVSARKVFVEDFEILSWDGMRRVEFSARVKKGVYVRTLVHDLGQKLGCGAVLESLRRTETGGFHIEEAVQLSTLKMLSDIKSHLKPITSITRRNQP